MFFENLPEWSDFLESSCIFLQIMCKSVVPFEQSQVSFSPIQSFWLIKEVNNPILQDFPELLLKQLVCPKL